ncbi:hypothetical protein E4U53_007215, partial [Claviceps sorghi]
MSSDDAIRFHVQYFQSVDWLLLEACSPDLENIPSLRATRYATFYYVSAFSTQLDEPLPIRSGSPLLSRLRLSARSRLTLGSPTCVLPARNTDPCDTKVSGVRQ